MNSKKSTSIESLRTVADAAVAKWKALDGIAKAKRAAADAAGANRDAAEASALFQSSPHDDTRETVKDRKLCAASTHREALEAEESAERAREPAISALDAAEAAEGDAIALARSPKRLHEDVVALDAEERKLSAQLVAVRRQRSDRVVQTEHADTAHANRRREAGLPTSAPVPRSPSIMLGVRPRTYLQVLAEHVENGVPSIDFTDRIKAARADELRIAADIEERRLEKEANAKDKEEKKRERDQAFEDQQNATRARLLAQGAAFAADAKEREKLGTDLLARRAGGAGR